MPSIVAVTMVTAACSLLTLALASPWQYPGDYFNMPQPFYGDNNPMHRDYRYPEPYDVMRSPAGPMVPAGPPAMPYEDYNTDMQQRRAPAVNSRQKRQLFGGGLGGGMAGAGASASASSQGVGGGMGGMGGMMGYPYMGMPFFG